jgi:hypothetical protein
MKKEIGLWIDHREAINHIHMEHFRRRLDVEKGLLRTAHGSGTCGKTKAMVFTQGFYPSIGSVFLQLII